MFFLEGPESFLRSVLTLTSGYQSHSPDIKQLRRYYVDFAVLVGGEAVRPADIDQQYCYDENRILALVSKYKDYSQLTDIETDTSETPYKARVKAMNAVNTGKERMKGINPVLCAIFDFAIHTIFYHRSKESGGGSVSSAPGVIWCAPRLNWTPDDMAEFLVHELTHNMLFIDERRYQHYIDFDDIAKPENYARSAILMRPRPLDKVFHSLIVSHEVISFRLENGEPEAPNVHPSNTVMLDAAHDTIESIHGLLSNKSLVTSRFMELLDKIEASFTLIANEKKRDAVIKVQAA